MSLLVEKLKQVWPAENHAPYGTCLLIPNKAFRTEWMKQLEDEGCKVYMNGLNKETYAFVKLPIQKTHNNANEASAPAEVVPSRPWTREEYEKLKELHDQSLPLKDIAASLNRTKSSIVHKLYDRHFNAEYLKNDSKPVDLGEANKAILNASDDSVVKEFLTCVSELYPRYPQVCKFLLLEASNRILKDDGKEQI